MLEFVRRCSMGNQITSRVQVRISKHSYVAGYAFCAVIVFVVEILAVSYGTLGVVGSSS